MINNSENGACGIPFFCFPKRLCRHVCDRKQAVYRNYRGKMLAEVCYLLTRRDYLENREFYQS